MRFLIAYGSTATAEIEGISAAGTDPSAMYHTPAADAEIVTYGSLIRSPTVPMSPTGCPTPAVITRAISNLLDIDPIGINAGLQAPTAAPTIDMETPPGGDIREEQPVPTASTLLKDAREVGRNLPDDHITIGESIPGGTTTALGVLRALGEPYGVSSSLPQNPLSLKERVVADSLATNNHDQGAATGDPATAIRCHGDPVLAVITGICLGVLANDRHITLAGGTQMVAVAALVRHAGEPAPMTLATTPFVAQDPAVELEEAGETLNVSIRVTDPGFEESEHVAMKRYQAGEAKEGVGMGGALALAADADISMTRVRAETARVYDSLLDRSEIDHEA